MITNISIENFKGIRDRVSLELKPITLLFGPNSAGKSTIFQALQYAREVLERHNLDPDQTISQQVREFASFSGRNCWTLTFLLSYTPRCRPVNGKEVLAGRLQCNILHVSMIGLAQSRPRHGRFCRKAPLEMSSFAIVRAGLPVLFMIQRSSGNSNLAACR